MAYGDGRAVVAFDTFDASIDGNWENGGGDWVAMEWQAGGDIRSTGIGNNGMRRNNETFDDDQFSTVTIDLALTSGNWYAAQCRMAAGTDETCYIGYTEIDGTAYRLYKVNSSFSFTEIGSGTTTGWANPAIGDTLTLEVEGTTLRVGDNRGTDTERYSQTDATISSGDPGLGGYSTGVGNVRYSAWIGGNITAVPPVIQSFTWRDEDTSGGNTCIADKASGIASGDLLLIIAMSDNDAEAGPVFSDNLTDWDFEGTVGNAATDVHLGIFSRIADTTEAATETITFSGAAAFRGAAYLRIDGHHATAWLDDLVTDTQETNATSHLIDAATSTVDDCLVIYGILADGADAFPIVLNELNGWIPDNEFISEQVRTDTAGFTASFGSKKLSPIGTTGVVDTDLTTVQDTSSSFQIVIAPPQGGGGPYTIQVPTGPLR